MSGSGQGSSEACNQLETAVDHLDSPGLAIGLYTRYRPFCGYRHLLLATPKLSRAPSKHLLPLSRYVLPFDLTTAFPGPQVSRYPSRNTNVGLFVSSAVQVGGTPSDAELQAPSISGIAASESNTRTRIGPRV